MDIRDDSSDSEAHTEPNPDKQHVEPIAAASAIDSQQTVGSSNKDSAENDDGPAPAAANTAAVPKPSDALEEDLETTQPYFKEPTQNEKTDDAESLVENPYKRKSVVPLPNSQSEEGTTEPPASQDSDHTEILSLANPYKRKSVVPLPNSQSEEDTAKPHPDSLSSQDSDKTVVTGAQPLANSQQSELEESQVVGPFRRKSLVPIASSETSEFDDSQVIGCKKAVVPLPSSQSDEDSTSNLDGDKKNEGKRPHSPNESESEGTEGVSTLAVNGTDDSSSDLLIIASPPETSEDHHLHKKRRVNSESNQEDSRQANEGEKTESEDSSPPLPSQFKLDDDGRDDLLEMLEQLSKETHRPASADAAAKEADVVEVAPEPASQFKLCDSDRDNLLNLLTDKEKDETDETGDDRRDESSKAEEGGLSNAGRNELLDLLNDMGKDSEKDSDTSDTSEDDEIETIRDSEDKPDDETSDNPDEENTDRFKLDEDERNELLNLLSEHLNDGQSDSSSNVDGSDSSWDSGNGDASAGQKRKASTGSNERIKRRKKAKGVDRDALLNLVNEYEEAVINGTDSNTDSILLDVLREEAVEENDTKKSGSGKSKDETEEAWNAYQALLDDDEDEEISETSSEISDLELEELEQRFSDQEKRRQEEARNAALREQFGINRELIVDVEAADISGFDISDFQTASAKQQGACSEIDRLCDLSDVLRKRTQGPPKIKRSRPTASNSNSSRCSSPRSDWSQSSDSEADDASLLANQDSFSNPNSPLPRAASDDDERERFANALFANIKNSSDENSGLSDEGVDSSSDEEEKKKRKPKAISLGAGDVKSKKKSCEGVEDSDSRSSTDGRANDNESDSNVEGDDQKKEKISKEVDLDSSDEEDFVGVRKGRGAWRHDPLLHECLTSDSDEDSDGSGSSKKRPRKRKENKSGRKADGDWDSDADSVKSDDMKTPVKKSILSDMSDDSDFEIIEKEKTPQKPILITDDEDTPSKWGKGRRNIRALVQDDELAEATQKAHNEEKERIRRLQERDKAKETLTQSQSFSSQLSEDEPEPLILDMNEDIQIKVHPKITQKLKPHQRDGIQFMWDSCYESIKQLKKGWHGSGCILAHCMGLGKTLQALALIQTLFTYSITKTKHVLVVCPLSTVSNWRNEYNLAFKNLKHSHVKLYTIENKKAARRRFDIVSKWWKTGGMLVIGYECFGLLINEQKLNKFEGRTVCHKESILKAMVDPGPDLIICDEGHLLRNKQSQRTLALNRVKTKRRIVLTGTPLQNNLLEYYYMVHFVKPNLLGTEKEYKTNFVNPISNGQFEDSTAEDIMFMKKRTHVLHKLLNRTVQRVEDTELKQYLPKLIDQAVFVKLSDLQVTLYNTYLDSANSRPVVFTKTGNISHKNFLADVQILRYICIHPDVVTTAEKNSKSKSNIKEQDVVDDNLDDVVEQKVASKGGWYKGLLKQDGSKKLELGSKMVAVLDLVKEAAACGDKVLIFSQSYAEMDNLEYFLTQHYKYRKFRDYYRMDGTISPELRTHMCDKFNKKTNTKVKVFIMSTKVGGLGLNLTAANRVIIMNVNWNPSYDTQSVFRSFRFGQKKAVYVYRLIAKDTMEEKMYQRVVTKLAIAHRVVDKHQITRHYSAADIQEFYSVRPTIGNARPVPNVPEDRVLATLIQKRQFVYRWHEHQALLANRPEEDLDEHQKNAAWEEFNKKEPTPPVIPGIQQQTPLPNYVTASSILGQAGPSGLQNRASLPVGGSQFKANGPGNLQGKANGQNKVNVPTSNVRHNPIHPDHNYSLPKSSASALLFHKSNSSDDFRHPGQAPKSYRPRQVFIDRRGSTVTRVINPVAGQRTHQPTTKQPVRLGSGITITSSAAALNAQKPSITITPSPSSNLVQNAKFQGNNLSPLNLITTPALVEQIKKVQNNQQLKTGGQPNTTTTTTTTRLNRANWVSRSYLQQKKIDPTPAKSNVTASATVSVTDTESNSPQSPLQKQMRSYMDHLHLLQAKMKEAHASTGQVSAASTTSSSGVSSASPTVVTSSTNNGLRPKTDNVALSAARNLSNFNKALHQLTAGLGLSRAPSGTSPIRAPVKPLMRFAGGTAPSKVESSRIQINGVPVTRFVAPGTAAAAVGGGGQISPKGAKRLVNRTLPISTGGYRRVIISPKNGVPNNSGPIIKSPNRVVPAKPTNNPLQRKMVANLNKLAIGAPPTTPPRGHMKTVHTIRKNGQSPRTISSLSSPSTGFVSKSNKENIKRRRLSLRAAHNARIAASIDLSKEDDGGDGSSGSLSQEVVDTLKKKGISINFVDPTTETGVIKLD